MEKIEYNGKEYNIKYRHARKRDADCNPDHRGGKTEAYIVLEWDADGKALKTISGEAICSDKDVYNKKMGRTIAKGRLFKKLK